MHLAASFTMVTNHLHGPDRARAAARGVGACGGAGDGDRWGLDPQGCTGGCYLALGVGRGRRGAPDGARLKASVGRLEGASEVTRLRFASRSQPLPSGDHQDA